MQVYFELWDFKYFGPAIGEYTPKSKTLGNIIVVYLLQPVSY